MRFKRVDNGIKLQFALGTKAHDFNAAAKTWIKGEHTFLPERRCQQKFFQVSREDFYRFRVSVEPGKTAGLSVEEYHPLDHTDYRATVERITASKADVVFNTIVPPAVTPFFEELYNSGFQKRGGKLICTYFDENFLNMVPAAHVEGLYGCLDYYQDVGDPISRALLNRYNKLFPGSAQFTTGSACTGLYRGLNLWAAAVQTAGTMDQTAVISALDRARIAEGPGGPAEVVPGQHHLRMNMYIAQAAGGQFKVVKSLGMIEPKERTVPGYVPAVRAAE